jgi:acetyltransferase-like isoleucine patch superfamily enzyme
MEDHCFAIDIYNDLGYYDDLDYKEAEDWGQFIDIDNIKTNTDFLYNKKENYTYIDKYEFKEIPKNNSLATKMFIRISSTTFITIGFTYFILSIL